MFSPTSAPKKAIMEAKDLPNWRSFEAALEVVRQELASEAIDKKCPPLLFRGQCDSEWPLTTTLERAGCQHMSCDAYYRLAVARAKPELESFTGLQWNVPDYSIELEKSFANDVELFSLKEFPAPDVYRYWIHLRHHGFPSPLLDWTRSPVIAAFFAFRQPGTQPRSIYVYCERPRLFKGGTAGEPTMRAIGKYVRAHPRHFRQQSDYTICAAFDSKLGWYFHPHDSVFWKRGRQDYLWKFNVPSSERIEVLQRLDDYNLSAFSLFDSQEALLETLWLREYVLRKE